MNNMVDGETDDGYLRKRSLAEEMMMSDFEREKKEYQVMSIEHSLAEQQHNHRNHPRITLECNNKNLGILCLCTFLLYAAFVYAGSGKSGKRYTHTHTHTKKKNRRLTLEGLYSLFLSNQLLQLDNHSREKNLIFFFLFFQEERARMNN